MTMVQAVIHPERAWIVADSLCFYQDGSGIVYESDGREREDLKLVALPKCVITGLGSLALRNRVEQHAHLIADVDAAIEQLPQILRDGFRELKLKGLQTSVVCGWSDSRGHMTLATFTAEREFKPTVYGSATTNCYTFWRCPDVPREPFAPCPDDLESLIANTHATVKHWRGIDPATPIGGALRLGTLERDWITLSIAGDLGMPTTHEKERDMRASIVAAGLALVACGGGEEAVEAVQIAPNAATESTFASTSSGTLTSSSGTVSAHVNTLTYVNDTAAAVSVEIHHSVKGFMSTAGAGTGAAWFAYAWSISSGGGAAAETSSNELTTENDFSSVQVVSVPAGHTLTAYLDAYVQRTGGTSATNNYRLANTSLAALKR